EIIDPRAAELLRRQADIVNHQQVDRCVCRAFIEVWRWHAPRLVDPVTGERKSLFDVLLVAHAPSVATKCDAGTCHPGRFAAERPLLQKHVTAPPVGAPVPARIRGRTAAPTRRPPLQRLWRV